MSVANQQGARICHEGVPVINLIFLKANNEEKQIPANSATGKT